ncbi:MAG: hypothetical protein ABSA01_06520 [Anaerolineales bacterium]|jgi:hypothetical protein
MKKNNPPKKKDTISERSSPSKSETKNSIASIQESASQIPNPSNISFENWIVDTFYEECGREITLAYTTLNQMQNWAVGMIAASIAATVALTKVTPGQSNFYFEITVPILIVAVIAYVFNLRFFIRAVLCYINLTRWNTLQNDVVKYTLVQQLPHNGQHPIIKNEAREKLLDDIRLYYLEWLSPISRSTQIFLNLKLGFYLMFALPLIFMLIGIPILWSNNVVKGFSLFAVFDTILEFYDFATSKYFDTKEKNANGKKKTSTFPIPYSEAKYFKFWILNLLICTIVVFWSSVQPILSNFYHLFISFFR